MNQTVFVVDVYSPFMKNKDVRKIFNYNEKQWCIRETALNWGSPKIELPFDDTSDLATSFHLYNTFEEANNYVEDLIGARL